MFAKWSSPEAAFQLMKQVSRGQPYEITGIRDYAHLEQSGGIQWPLPAVIGNSDTRNPNAKTVPPATERRLFADGKFFTADGRAKFIFEAPRNPPEPTNAEFPFMLLTGRGTSSQWHTQTRTAKSDVLRKLYPQKIYAEISPSDAARLRLAAGDSVVVRSRRGTATATAFITATIQPGQVFLPMHYAETNLLTHWSVDPYSRQPNYKFCAVSLERSAS